MQIPSHPAPLAFDEHQAVSLRNPNRTDVTDPGLSVPVSNYVPVARHGHRSVAVVLQNHFHISAGSDPVMTAREYPTETIAAQVGRRDLDEPLRKILPLCGASLLLQENRPRRDRLAQAVNSYRPAGVGQCRTGDDFAQ